MQFVLTDNEAVEFIRTAVRRNDGTLLFDIPANRLLENSERRPSLAFTPETRTVCYGQHNVRLAPKEFALLQHVHQYGRVSFEEAQDAVWHHSIGDHVLRNTCSRISTRLLDAKIPFAALTRNGSIILEKAA
jgi:DNA-binding response OmpR family regulator